MRSGDIGYGTGRCSAMRTSGSAMNVAPRKPISIASNPAPSPLRSQSTDAPAATSMASAPPIACDATAVPRAIAPIANKVRLRFSSSTKARPRNASANTTALARIPCSRLKTLVKKSSNAAIPPAVSPNSLRPKRYVTKMISPAIGSIAAVSASGARRVALPNASVA